MSDFSTRIMEESRANGGQVSVDFDGGPLIRPGRQAETPNDKWEDKWP